MSRLWLPLITAAIFVLAWMQSSALEPQQESGILPIDPPTPYFHYHANGNSTLGRVLVVHGLDVSKETMRLISAALADGGFDVYIIDLPGHGDSTSPFRTDAAEQVIRNSKLFLGDNTIVLGHSLGAGLLLDLAATEPFTTLVLLSTPPIPVAEIHADRVLAGVGDLDIPRIQDFVPIVADIGDPKVESSILHWGGHSAPVFNPAYIRRIVAWLGGDGGRTRTMARMLWIAVMFCAAAGFGVALMPKVANGAKSPPWGRRGGRDLKKNIAKPPYRERTGWLVQLPINRWLEPTTPSARANVASRNLLDRAATPPSLRRGLRLCSAVDVSMRATLARYIVAGCIALFTLKLVHPFTWLRLFTTDYLIGILFVSGLVLTVAALYERGISGGHRPPLQLHTSIIAAAFVVIVPGLIVASRVLHMSLSDGRWWRFPCIVLAGLPLFISDELTIRQIHPRWKSEAAALLTRTLLLAFILTGVVTFNREDLFLVLIAPLITVFWIALWLMAGVVHRHTQSPIAAALFAAIVQGWAFAAWFVTI